ncbi:phosphoribosylamine--glycine ligase [Crenalkalicoccus roseus]|uniref:phosphoribosylamine--glycine ligase n=1 Tax=Crenalkalicoccus roseus TaxID=1485588 RepID=UPI0010822D41|nr:phosphoribosylamine--glycine ligase [Crenalkalicoccus roseus]
MTRLLPALCALLLLAGCARTATRPALPPGEDTPAHRACRAEARRAPEIRALDRQANPFDPANQQRLAEERSVLEQRAYRDCLRRAGLTLPGGVEPLRRR